jgi:hypothetical protein
MFMILLLIGSLGISGCNNTIDNNSIIKSNIDSSNDVKISNPIQIESFGITDSNDTKISKNLFIKNENNSSISSEENSSNNSDNYSSNSSESSNNSDIVITDFEPKFFSDKNYCQNLVLDKENKEDYHEDYYISITFSYDLQYQLDYFVLFDTSKLNYNGDAWVDSIFGNASNSKPYPYYDLILSDYTSNYLTSHQLTSFYEFKYSFTANNYNPEVKNNLNYISVKLLLNSSNIWLLQTSINIYITSISYHTINNASVSLNEKIFNIDPLKNNFGCDDCLVNNETIKRNSVVYLINYLSFFSNMDITKSGQNVEIKFEYQNYIKPPFFDIKDYLNGDTDNYNPIYTLYDNFKLIDKNNNINYEINHIIYREDYNKVSHQIIIEFLNIKDFTNLYMKFDNFVFLFKNKIEDSIFRGPESSTFNLISYSASDLKEKILTLYLSTSAELEKNLDNILSFEFKI